MGKVSGAKVGSLNLNSDVIVAGFFLCIISEIGSIEFSMEENKNGFFAAN